MRFPLFFVFATVVASQDCLFCEETIATVQSILKNHTTDIVDDVVSLCRMSAQASECVNIMSQLTLALLSSFITPKPVTICQVLSFCDAPWLDGDIFSTSTIRLV